MIKGVLMDYGGTLDSNGNHWGEVLWEIYRELKVPVKKEDFREAYVFGERSLATRPYILPEHNFLDVLSVKATIQLNRLAETGKLPAEFDRASASAGIASAGYERARRAVEAARPIVERISRRYSLVLVSNFYGNIESVLSDFALTPFFLTVIESARVGVRKPDPRIFSLGAEALGLKPEETVVVGDSYKKDILPALEAGCRAIWLKGKGWTDEEDRQTYEPVITDFGQLPELLLG